MEAVLDGRVIGRAMANAIREDLLPWGKGTGRYGFSMTFDDFLVGDEAPTIRIVPETYQTLRGTNVLPPLTPAQRQLQARGTIDGLMADHSRFTAPGPDFEELDETILSGLNPTARVTAPLVFAFYLPQFHSIAENDRFWGKGFTEWRQLARALPRFPGHYQPRIPRDLGFYELGDDAVLREQARMALASGIGAFGYYYYWFNGKRVLDRPIDAHLASDLDMPFLIMWANENWTKTWDGFETDVLLRQDYKQTDEDALLDGPRPPLRRPPLCPHRRPPALHPLQSAPCPRHRGDHRTLARQAPRRPWRRSTDIHGPGLRGLRSDALRAGRRDRVPAAQAGLALSGARHPRRLFARLHRQGHRL